MHIAKMALVAAASMMLAACGKDPAATETRQMPLTGKRLDPRKQNSGVARMFSVQGRWEGPQDSSPAGRHIVLDMAGISQFTLDVRGTEAGQEVVFESAQGGYAWTPSGIMKGTLQGKPGPLLAKYRTFEAGFPANGTMTLRTASGDVELRQSLPPGR